MSVIFNHNNMGKSIGFRAQDAAVTPLSKITLGIDQDVPTTSGVTNSAVIVPIKDYIRSGYNEHVIDIADKIYKGLQLLADEYNPFGTGSTPKKIADILKQQGPTDAVRPINMVKSAGGHQAANAEDRRRAWSVRQPLDTFIKPLGLVLGTTLNFSDNPAPSSGLQLEVQAKQLYNGSISGITFDGACKLKKETHGLEPLLEYYWYHRISNAKKDITKTTLKIGTTVLRGWVVGMDLEPLNLDFRIWSWKIHLKISPDYRPSLTFGGDVPDRISGITTLGYGEGT